LLIETQPGDRMVAPDQKQRADKVFKALADCTRRQILCLLSESSQSVTDIVEHFHLTQPSISRHLAILRTAELVDYERQGQRMIYRLGGREPLELAMGFLGDLSCGSSAAPPNGKRRGTG
jgi:DNA-binding transcriptional ArsR family regulator